jgi:hypothetical protein
MNQAVAIVIALLAGYLYAATAGSRVGGKKRTHTTLY